MIFDREDAAGRAIVIGGPSGSLSLVLDGPAAMARPALLLPLDQAFRRRTNEAIRLGARLLGYRLPPHLSQPITPARSLHLIRCLHAFDLDRAGASIRRVAAVLCDPRAETMPNGEWSDHAWRRSARSWRDEGIALVEGGYLKLLTEG